MSKKDAFAEWSRLAAEERHDAIASLNAFKHYCQTHTDYRPVHANRYLRSRRFETVGAKDREAKSRTFIVVGSPQWEAWHGHSMRTRGRGYPTSQRQVEGRMVSGWDFPTPWPPEEQPNLLAAAE